MKRGFLFWTAAILGVIALSCSGSDSNSGSSDNGSSDKKPSKSGSKTETVTIYQPDENCDAHEMLCNGVCTDIKHSINNCGDCGKKCKADETCNNGKCSGCEKTTCDSECVDLTSDANHCGSCDNPCAPNMVCSDSKCECAPDYTDCDGDPINGCETLLECECVLGQERSYYNGPEGTKDVGECKAGKLTCIEDEGIKTFDITVQPTLPTIVGECTKKDYNCNGIPDGEEDLDGDGFTTCDGDCCNDTTTCTALNPELINPGMLEVKGNKLDDNCDTQTDEDQKTSKDVTPIDYTYGSSDMDTTARAMAQAMGIIWECKKDMTCAYGLVNARLTRSESTALPDAKQVNILDAMRDESGTARIMPQEGKSFAVMSSGHAKDVKSGVSKEDEWFEERAKDDETVGENLVQRYPKDSQIPNVYLQNHDNKLATHKSCPANASITPAIFDSVQLHLELKVPVNVKGIAFDFRFLSQEYPKYLCSAFNDFFLALLTSKHPDLAGYPDHNIAFDKVGNPVSVNNGFFTTCDYIPCKEESECPKFMTCSGEKCINKECTTNSNGEETCTPSKITCQDGSTAIDAYYPYPYAKYDYQSTTTEEGRGGATAWLSTTAPVVGGETIQLDFYIWDTQDGNYDSTVLLDNFRWLVDETKVNTGFADPPVN